MTERERLVELLFNAETNGKKIKERVADYLIANGVIVPPVKVGDTVYIKGEALEISFMQMSKEETLYCIQLDCGERDCYVCPFYEDEVSWEGEHDCRTYGYIEFTASDIGKTVFLTREEAEKALKEREENGST